MNEIYISFQWYFKRLIHSMLFDWFIHSTSYKSIVKMENTEIILLQFEFNRSYTFVIGFCLISFPITENRIVENENCRLDRRSIAGGRLSWKMISILILVLSNYRAQRHRIRNEKRKRQNGTEIERERGRKK